MNCRPGDLAQLKGLTSFVHLNGRPVTVLSYGCNGSGVTTIAPDGKTRWTSIKGGVHWFCESQTPIFHTRSGRLINVGLVADVNLRPIRDPGDDAQDETLSWLPVPHGDEVPA